MFKTDGSTVRARGVIPLIKKKHYILIISRSACVNYDLLQEMNIKRDELIIIGQCSKNPYLDIILRLFWNFKLIRVLIKNRVHLVYGQGVYQFLAYFVSRALKKKFIYEAHAVVYKEQAQTSKTFALLLYFFEFMIGKLANMVIGLSGEVCRFYRKINDNTFFVPVFIDTDLFCNKRGSAYKGLKKKVGLIGPFNSKFNRYQLEFLISNLERFDRRISFVLIGKCNKTLNSDRIVHLGYLNSKKEYVKALRHLDALLVPVKIATFGPKNKILETMACSLPVFTTPQGVVGLDFSKPGENILVYEEKNLVNKINNLLFDESLMRKIGKNAQETVKRYYSKSVCERKLLKIMEYILCSAK